MVIEEAENLLSDLSEIGIPLNSVRPEATAMPQVWDMKGLLRFAAVMGPTPWSSTAWPLIGGQRDRFLQAEARGIVAVESGRTHGDEMKVRTKSSDDTTPWMSAPSVTTT